MIESSAELYNPKVQNRFRRRPFKSNPETECLPDNVISETRRMILRKIERHLNDETDPNCFLASTNPILINKKPK